MAVDTLSLVILAAWMFSGTIMLSEIHRLKQALDAQSSRNQTLEAALAGRG